MGLISAGMEVASYLSNKAASVTVVGTSSYPFQKSLGQDIGKMCMQVRSSDGCDVNFCVMKQILKQSFFYQMFEEKNVKFYMNDGITEIRGNNGKVALFLFIVLLCPFLYKPLLKLIYWFQMTPKIHANKLKTLLTFVFSFYLYIHIFW